MERDQQIYNELKTIKSKIEKFIYNGNFEEARQALGKYEQVNPDDIDVYNLKAVIFLLEQKFDEAKLILTEGLRQAPFHPDLIFNLAYTHEQQQNYQQAYELYYDAAELFDDENKRDEARQATKRIEEQQASLVMKKKIAFFVKKGMDSFLGNVISGLEQDYRVIKIEVTDLPQINEAMKWADICWFEWCDELIIYGSQQPLATQRKIICRIHGYEVYTPNIIKTNWNSVDQLIVVAPHILKLFKAKVNADKLKNTKINLVYCGVEVSKYPFKEKNRGFNIGYLGYINFKKNLPLTLDIFLKLHSKDNRYKLFLAGEFQDERTYRYIEFFINEHNLKDNIVFEGWKDYENKIKWFEKINYILISSIDEGLCYAAAESMLSGIKPVLHNCEGLKDHYPPDYLFNTLEEAIEKIEENEYSSREYRSFIEKNYASDKQSEILLNVIMDLLDESRLLKQKKVSLIYRTLSGSNTVALYKLMPKDIKNNLNISLIKEENNKQYLDITAASQVVVTTHGNYRYSKQQVNIDLWHGFPLKAMGYMDKNESGFSNELWDNIDALASYSPIYNTVFNSCIGIDASKFITTGAPRNDFLFISKGKQNLEQILNIDTIDQRIIFFMPTFRFTFGQRKDGQKNWDNIFGMQEFKNREFEEFLLKNKIQLIMKLHPNEEGYVINEIKKNKLENVHVLTNEMLEKSQLDLYELLNATDILITDYSSVYFDFLLLNRPIIFTPIDLDIYKENRGFLLEPYSFWTPGPKVLTQNFLQQEIIKSLNDSSYYEEQRKEIANVVHHYKDGKSSERVWDLIKKLAEKKYR